MFTVRVYVRSQGEVPTSHESNNFLPSGLLLEWDKGQFLSLVGSCGICKVTGLLMDTGNFWEEICWTLTYSHDISGSFLNMLLFSPPPGPRSWDRTVESRYDQNASQPTVYESTARTSAPQPVSSGEGAVIWTMVIMLYSIHIPLDSLDSIFQGKPGGATNNEGFP